ncbi:MAG: YgfZ/GcvT domain-containing protein [Solirubrobacterales bacterium]
MADVTAAVELDGQYRSMREGAGLLDRSDRGKLLVRGADAAEYLQGQLTNEIVGLDPDQGCYTALLDRKGHVVADMRVLRLSHSHAGGIWLDSEATALEPLRKHLETYKIGREVEVVDETEEWGISSLIGPGSAKVAGSAPLSPEYTQHYYVRDGIEILAVATDLGLDLITRSEAAEALREQLLASGADPVTEEAAEIVRVESGRPRFGHDFDGRTMPAEAGIVERAVDFEKGCYIGQEPVARLHYRGKPNRRLVGLRLSAPAERGAALRLGEREVGAIGSACVSPARGPIALAVVRREADAGDRLEVGDGELTAEVAELPFAA